MNRKRFFLILVTVLSIGLFVLFVMIVSSRVVMIAGESGGGIGGYAGGASWSLLRTLLIVALLIFLGVAGLIWSKRMRRQ